MQKKNNPNLNYNRNRTRYSDYVDKVTSISEGAETPAEKKAAPKRIAALDKTIGWASRTSGGMKGKAAKAVSKVYKTY
jgi:hypothetical protein